jgi:hypothetical protein
MDYLTAIFLLPHMHSLAHFQGPKEWAPDHYDTILIRASDSTTGSILMEETTFLWQPPKLIANLMQKIEIVVLSVKQGADNTTAIVTLRSTGLALYVVLTTECSGKFAENVFALRPNVPKVREHFFILYFTFQTLCSHGIASHK